MSQGSGCEPYENEAVRNMKNEKQMKMETIVTIDTQRLREDLRNEDLDAYFGGGFGGALMEALDVDSATPEELIQIAQDRGVDLKRYVIDE